MTEHAVRRQLESATVSRHPSRPPPVQGGAGPGQLGGVRPLEPHFHGAQPLDAIARRVVADHEAARSGGEPLPAALRLPAEAALGADLGGVRLHRDGAAGRFVRTVGAKAAEIDGHVFVRPELFDTAGERGRTLIGHELVHAAQHAVRGSGPRAVSHPREAAEVEARRLGPRVLGGEAAGGRGPLAKPAAALSLDPVDDQLASLPPQICDPDTWEDATQANADAGIDTQSGAMDAGAGEEGSFGSDPSADADAGAGRSDDPTLIDVPALSNRSLIELGIETRGQILGFIETSPETEAWADLERRIEAERALRVTSGFVFMAAARTSVPDLLLQLVPGEIPGTTAIYVAFPEFALGTPHESIPGIILTEEQLKAYTESAGMMEADSAAALRAIEILRTGDTGRFETEFSTGAREPGYGPNLTYGRMNRNPLANEMVTAGPMADWLMPLTDRSNIVGHMGEASFFFGSRANYGRGAVDLNVAEQTWTDVLGRQHKGDTPLADFLLRYGQPPLPYGGRPVSNAATGQLDQARATRMLMAKMGQMLDVPGRRLEGAAPILDTTDMAEAHVREMARNAGLNRGTPEFAEAERRFLGDTLFAVPRERLAEIRDVVRQPWETPKGSNKPALTEGYRALYDQVLREAPITGTRRNKQPVTIASFAELIEVLPNEMRSEAKGDPVPEGGPGLTALTKDSREAALKLLGQMAEARVIANEDAPAMIASSDLLRQVGEPGSTALETRVLSIDRANLAATGRRMRNALGDPRTADDAGELGWITRRSRSESDNFLSALRLLSGQPNLDRTNPDGTPNPEFVRLRAQLTQEIVLSIPEGQRAPLIEAVINSQSDLATDIRQAFLTDNPTIDVSGIEGLAGKATTTFDLDTPALNRTEKYFSGLDSAAQMSPDALTLAQQPGWGRGLAGRLPGSVGRTLWANALGYGVTAGYDVATGHETNLPGFAQAGIDLGIGLASEEAERVMAARLASSALFARLPLGSAVFRGAAQKAAPTFVIQPLISVGMGEISMSEDRELYAELGIEMSDEEIRSRRMHNLGVGAVGAGASAVVLYAAAGSLAGPPGALVGFLIGVGVIATGALAGIVADRAIAGGRDEWIERHREEIEARAAAERQRMEEIRRGQRPVQTLEAGKVPIPYRPSQRISADEQRAIAEWFLGNARRADVGSGASVGSMPAR